MRFRLSIRTQLTAYISLFVLLVLVVATTAIIAVSALNHDAEAIDQKWLAGTRVLSELGRQVSEFRLSETDRALASDSKFAADAETTAEHHRDAVEGAVGQYVTIIGAEPAQAELAAFRRVWGDYLVLHNAWVRADAYRNAGSLARANSSLHWRYKGVAEAVDQLKSVNYSAADNETAAAKQSVEIATYIVLAASVIAVILAIWLSMKIRTTITRPLGSITAALSQLAGGCVGVRVPEADRDDEIGEMAKAFEVFRANAAELESAHAATRLAQEHAHSLARHDALTGLPNRRVFAAELETALARANTGEASYAVMLVDLDRFKPVNDVQGHSAGDQVLCEVARRLESIASNRKTVARLGGDEFAVIAEADFASVKQEAMEISSRILAVLREPIHVGDARIEIGASIGIALCPSDGATAEEIIHASDLAMYRAKKDGRDTFRFFEQSMDEELRAQSVLEEDFREALRTGEILPFYQPLIGLDEERLCGFEVLARWHHPVRGFIPPDKFVAMAERLGLIGDLSAAILRQACRDARDWGDEIRLALNVSPLQLTDRLFPAKILAILSEEGFKPSRLEIEITESALVGDIELARDILSSLQRLGITISLDDFGTGYSSLYHLRNLKFDKLKIDRSFVQSMQTNAESAKIVDAVLGLAKSLGMSVVAEGVEDEGACLQLIQRGCDFGQGFYFSQAVPAAKASKMLSVLPLLLSA